MMLPKIQQHNGLPKAVIFIQIQQVKALAGMKLLEVSL